MGGRGARLGKYYLGGKWHTYGDEYETVLKSGNIKFVQRKDGKATTAPMETMTKGRIYVTINKQNQVKHISYYDKNMKKYKQIDVSGPPHKINGVKELPHTHLGYDTHKGTGEDTRVLTIKEHKMVDRVLKEWNYYSRNSK